MKKIFFTVLVLAMAIGGASVALAADLTDEEVVAHHEEMLKIKEERLDELVDEGNITQEEADEFIQKMEERFEAGDCDGAAEGLGNGIFSGSGKGMGRGIGLADGSGSGLGRGYGCEGGCINE